MSRLLVVAAGLTGIYLLVLTSVSLGDVLVGGALGVAVAFALRPARWREGRRMGALFPAVVALAAHTAVEMLRGSWRTARFCVGAPAAPGLVEIPRGPRTDAEVAIWGVATGEAPDEFPVDVDEARDVLLVHVLDASDPDAVRARHARALERWRGGSGRGGSGDA
jgi:multisubunit Na+/H+ antiporter MnhE subunit